MEPPPDEDRHFRDEHYPQRHFRQTFGHVMNPGGNLLTPEQLKKRNKKNHETVTRALQQTFEKLDDLRRYCFVCERSDKVNRCARCQMVYYCGQKCQKKDWGRHKKVCKFLSGERIDQVAETLPCQNACHVLKPGRAWTKPAGEVATWADWLAINPPVAAEIQRNVPSMVEWYNFIGRPATKAAVTESLQRCCTEMLTHPIVIGKGLVTFNVDPRAKPVHIHMVGAAKPELLMSEIATSTQELSAMIPNHQGMRILLVGPEVPHKLALGNPPSNKALNKGRIEYVYCNELYHDFVHRYVDHKRCPVADLVIALHPGLHTEVLIEPWTPTINLLLDRELPTVFTMYNVAEYDDSVEILAPFRPNYVQSGTNPFGSLLAKQTPFDLNQVFASNSYILAMKGRQK
ncbi:translational activator for mitochondrial COX1 [Branchiostoma belcheri]|nr:translational activator for mitochondrial COX1 [Branchiostoma belcheri]